MQHFRLAMTSQKKQKAAPKEVRPVTVAVRGRFLMPDHGLSSDCEGGADRTELILSISRCQGKCELQKRHRFVGAIPEPNPLSPMRLGLYDISKRLKISKLHRTCLGGGHPASRGSNFLIRLKPSAHRSDLPPFWHSCCDWFR